MIFACESKFELITCIILCVKNLFIEGGEGRDTT